MGKTFKTTKTNGALPNQIECVSLMENHLPPRPIGNPALPSQIESVFFLMENYLCSLFSCLIILVYFLFNFYSIKILFSHLIIIVWKLCAREKKPTTLDSLFLPTEKCDCTRSKLSWWKRRAGIYMLLLLHDRLWDTHPGTENFLCVSLIFFPCSQKQHSLGVFPFFWCMSVKLATSSILREPLLLHFNWCTLERSVSWRETTGKGQNLSLQGYSGAKQYSSTTCFAVRMPRFWIPNVSECYFWVRRLNILLQWRLNTLPHFHYEGNNHCFLAPK